MKFTETMEKLGTRLRKIAGDVTDNKADQADLLQEGWVYLWENREKLKNKTISYILTGCYFRFIDYFRQGRSIDSKVRKNVIVISLYYTSDERDTPLVSNIPSEVVEDAVNILIAKDLEKQIRKRLNRKLRQTYDLLLEEYSLAEIANELDLTDEAIRLRVKNIRRIAKDYLMENLDF